MSEDNGGILGGLVLIALAGVATAALLRGKGSTAEVDAEIQSGSGFRQEDIIETEGEQVYNSYRRFKGDICSVCGTKSPWRCFYSNHCMTCVAERTGGDGKCYWCKSCLTCGGVGARLGDRLECDSCVD